MPIDPRIALGVQPMQMQLPDPNSGMNSLAKVMQLRDMQASSQLNTLKADEYRRGLADQTELRSAMAGGADPMNTLLKLGRVKEATDYAKGQADISSTRATTEKNQIEAAHKRIDAWGQVMGQVRQNPTVENATAGIQYLVNAGAMTQEHAAPILAQIQQNPTPQNISQFAEMSFRGALQAKDQLPKYETRNTGGTTDTMAIDPVTGQVRVANSVKNTQSPDNAASNARMAADAAASRSVQIRGQDMTDARTRESTAASITKPFEITGEDGKPVLVQQDRQGNIRPVQGYAPKQGASKPLTDTQAKALQFGSRMQAAEGIFDTMAKAGTEAPSRIKQAVEGAPMIGPALGAAANSLVASPNQQSVEQAQRDFVNAVLRRESGAAISPTEFDSAKRQYFPAVGDSDQVKAQKKANRELATRGILAEVPDSENRVAKVRAGGAGASKIDTLLDKYK